MPYILTPLDRSNIIREREIRSQIYHILVLLCPFAYWVILHVFLSSADFFSKSTFTNIYFKKTIRVSNSLYSDRFVGPDLGPKLFATFISRRRK